MIQTLLLLIAALSSVHASTDPYYQVVIYDPNVDMTTARRDFPDAYVYSVTEAAALRRKAELPLDKQREFLLKSRLEKYVVNKDQLEKDMLVRFLRESTPEQMHARYRDIPVEICANAITLLKTFDR